MISSTLLGSAGCARHSGSQQRRADDRGANSDGACGCLFPRSEQNGIYALVWKIADEDKARSHFCGRLNLGLTQEACISLGFAIEPQDFLGARHKFVGA
ncbi:hypothetical protein GR702_06180 [Novosphingobium sp. FGD1]|jgi:hypothetical protein|uniref:Uncharacterized protein n=1 Tax=Novosphingobium silvae TaxID=2692619 RepID=A0A7X4GEZ8_9SPHN|nr:hypothetical protein [Novosphingobium silvae]MYL97361.1 hypothetical protein [Novosphingobium silvae]